MKFYFFALLSIIIVISAGCLETNNPKFYQDVTGVVLDATGEPVPNADIHIRNHFNTDGFPSRVIGDSVLINFTAPSRNLYRASIYRYEARSFLNTFFEDSLDEGEQELMIPDSLLSNGLFGFQVSTPSGALGGSLFVVNKPDTALINTLPFTQTNSEGNFRLTNRFLAIGNSFNASFGEFEITDSLQIIVVQDSLIKAKEAVKLKPNSENFYEITID